MQFTDTGSAGHYRAHLARVAGLGWLVLLAAFPGRATALDFRLRWQPSDDPRVTGYNVHVRPPGVPYGVPRAAGLPNPGPDGSMSFVVTGLADLPTQLFAVTARTAEGLESRLSNELALGPRNICAADRCFTPTGCDFSPLPDGALCGGETIDPCAAVCVAGGCTTAHDTAFITNRLTVTKAGGSLRFSAKGTFVPSVPLEPTGTQLTLTLYEPSGLVVYSVSLSGDALAPNRAGTVLHYRDRRGSLQGLTYLKLRRQPAAWSVVARAAPLIPPSATPVTLSVLIGSQCVRGTNLAGPGNLLRPRSTPQNRPCVDGSKPANEVGASRRVGDYRGRTSLGKPRRVPVPSPTEKPAGVRP